MAEQTYFNNLKARCLNNRWVAYLVLVVVIVTGAAGAWKQLSELFAPKPPLQRPAAASEIVVGGERARVDDLLRPIYFLGGSYQVSREEHEKVLKYAALLAQTKYKSIILKSHTTAKSPIPNFNLSAARADTIRQVLNKAGVPSAKIEVANFAGEQADSAPAPGYADRVELKVIWD